MPFGAFNKAHAQTVSFDETSVLADLSGATIYGKSFDVADYPKNAYGELRLLDFVEYSFSVSYDLRDYYGLYLYVYNPTGEKIEDHVLNKIQIATEYTETGEPSKYEKFSITICNASYDNLFYKFKITGIEKLYNRVTQKYARRYDISGIEIYSGGTNATEYSVGGTWTYTGYAKGCHSSSEEESTLNVEIKSLQTIVLNNLKHTYYRTWNNLANTSADQLNAVYFSVPGDIANLYDELYSIQAETWKYLTSPIFCVYDKYIFGVNSPFADYSKIYETLYSQRGIDSPDGIHLLWDANPDATQYFTAYNLSSDTLIMQNLDKLAWVFQVSQKEDWTVSSDRLLAYMSNYSDTFGKDIQGKYSSDLFSYMYYSLYWDYKTVENGYMRIDVNVSGEDDYTLVGSSSLDSWWSSRFWNGNPVTEEISPIIAVSYDELKNMSDTVISETYFIAGGDVIDFKQYCRDENAKGRVVYLFRFAQSEYMTTPVCGAVLGVPAVVGYMAQEVAYLDFDIISLGYRLDNVINIIPAVSSPIDIISAVEPGINIPDIGWPYWVIIAGICAAVVVIVVVSRKAPKHKK